MLRIGLFLFASLSFLCPPVVSAGVYVHDAVAVQGEEIRLKAETRGKVFARGGELVEFFVGDDSLGKNLSGGDGVAYRFFRPSRTGLKTVRVASGAESGTGYLLVLRPGAALVAVDVEGTLLMEGFLSPGRPGSRDAVAAVAGRYPLVYLQSGQTNLRALRHWLDRNEYAGAPLLPWEGGAVFRDLDKKGLKIRAVVGGPAVIESAARYRPQAFSFEPLKGAVRLKSWKELEGHLQ